MMAVENSKNGENMLAITIPQLNNQAIVEFAKLAEDARRELVESCGIDKRFFENTRQSMREVRMRELMLANESLQIRSSEEIMTSEITNG